jgi:hypothetical protein
MGDTKFEVKTFIDFTNKTIMLEVRSCRIDREHLIANQLLDLQERAIREALMALGWTPPPEGFVARYRPELASPGPGALGDTSEKPGEGS